MSDYIVLTVPEEAFGYRITEPNWCVRYEDRIRTEQPAASQTNQDEMRRRIRYIIRDNTQQSHTHPGEAKYRGTNENNVVPGA